MIDNIAILITGNPVSSSGVRSIGGIGTGLTVIDPKWPSMAQGDFALIITDKGQSSNYCLMFSSRLISSSGANREGVLNIQLQMPHGKVLADADGQMLSPFPLLGKVFDHYKQHHLTQYPGVEGWNFAKDWEMTQAEFDSLLAPYTLIDRVLPNRHLSGTGEAFIAMSPEKMSQFTLDYAYPELVDYGKVILSTVGSTNPPELTRLEIPRRPMFEIYVNGKKQDGLVREGDEAFPMTITPPNPSYQKTATVVVDFNKAAAEGKVDWANECINYTVEFEDLKHDWKVKVILTGLEGESSRDKIMKELLGAVYLESQAAGLYQPADKIKPNGRLANTLEFTLKGKQIISSWEPKWDNLPENVYKDEVKSLYRGFEVTFSYKKPQSNNGRRRDEQNRVDNSKPTVQKKEVEIVPVYITTENSTDEKLLNSIRKLKVDVTLLVERSDKNDYLATFYGVRGDLDKRETITIDGKEHSCYVGEIKVPLELWENKWNKQTGKKVDVESSNQKYDLSARFYEGCVIAFAKKASKLAIFWRNWGNVVSAVAILLVGGFIGTVVENDKDFWSNSKAVVAPNAPQGTSDPVVTVGDNGRSVYINNEIEVTIGENGHWIIDGEDNGESPYKIAAEKTPTGNAGRERDDNPVATGSDNVDYAALDRVAADYMVLIGLAEMSFEQVDEINRWVKANDKYGSKIKNYNDIKAMIKVYTDCRNLINRLYANDVYFDGIAPEVNNFVKGLNYVGYKQRLTELRKKMQCTFTDWNKADDKKVGDNIYNFVNAHPHGIKSFAELKSSNE